MGFNHYFPYFNLSRKIEYIKDYFIIMYFDLISSTFYKTNKSFITSYLDNIKLNLSTGYITSLNEACFYVPVKGNNITYKVPIIFTNENNILNAVDEKGRDLSPFLGPSKNFFGIKLTPKDIGCKEVIITIEKDESVKRFTENETILF